MIHSNFDHSWRAEILPASPLIMPARTFVYPAQVEEVERGALHVLIRSQAAQDSSIQSQTDSFLAICALGFGSPQALSGVWACPHPDWLCAVAGGYAYLIHTRNPGEWEQIEYRPVTEIYPVPDRGLLVFAGFHSLLAWGKQGKAWQTARLSWDGIRIQELKGGELLGLGWDMRTDRELEFQIDLETGQHSGGGYLP